VYVGLGRLELRANRVFRGLGNVQLALRIRVLLLKALEVVCLPERLGAERAKAGRERLAVLGIALCLKVL